MDSVPPSNVIHSFTFKNESPSISTELGCTFFNLQNEKFDPKAFALQEKLDQFSIHGLKPFPIRLLSLGDRASNHDEEIFELVSSQHSEWFICILVC